MTTTATIKELSGNWWRGTVLDGMIFEAKVYDEPSQYGINGGRISKLCVTLPGRGWDRPIYSYDRGEDVNFLKPEALAEIVAFIEGATK